LPEELRDLIVSRAEGNPFFSEELALALRDAGVIRVEDGVCRLAPGADLHSEALPTTLQGVITSRIDRLSVEQQLTLKVASVVGRSFGLRILHAIHPINERRSDLLEDLDALERAALAQAEKPDPELTYIFKHLITQEVAYSLLPFSQRQQLHRGVAEFYEQHQEELAVDYSLIAFHWSRAEDAAKTVKFLELAGEQAIRNGGYGEAARFFEDAIGLEARAASTDAPPLVDRSQLAAWHAQLGVAQYNISAFRSSRQSLNAALRLLGEPVHTTTVGLVTGFIWQLCLQARTRLLRRRPRMEHDEVALRVTRILQLASQVDYLTNETLPSMVAAISMVNAAERSAPSPDLMRAYGALCVTFGKIPLHPLARLYARLIEQTAQSVGESDPWADGCLGVYYQGIGDWENDAKFTQRWFDFYFAIGHGRMILDGSGMQYFSARWRGEFARSLEIAEQQMRWARTDDRQKVASYMNQARTLLTQDRPGEALEYMNIAASLERDWKDFDWFLVDATVAHAMLHTGNLQGACTHAGAAFRRMAGSRPIVTYGGEAFISVVEVQLDLLRGNYFEDGADRREALDELKRRIKRLAYTATIHPVWRPAARRYEAIQLALSGKAGAALKRFEESVQLARRLQMPHEEAQALYELARTTTDQDRARVLLEQAMAIFERIGARRAARLAREARSLLDATGQAQVTAGRAS
jgi:hypothetical protein